MCEPTMIFAGMSALASLAAQSQAANAQQAQNESQAEAERASAIANYDQLERRRQQEDAAAGQKIQANQIEAMKAQGTARTAAGESGITGLSVDALLRDLYGQEARYTDSVTQNFENASFEIDRSKENVQRQATSNINSLPIVQRPDYLGAAVQGGAGIYGAYKKSLKVSPNT